MRRGAWTLSVPWILAITGIALLGCGGGGGGGAAPATVVTTATIQGSLSGTIALAIDETGKVADTDDTTGKTPVNGKYPFTLTVPTGHQYTIHFIVNEGLATEKILFLYEGGTNIFSVASAGTLDLGFVDTSGTTASADNTIIGKPGVTSGGTTGDNTIRLAGPSQGYKYLYKRNERDGTITAKFHAQVKNADWSADITDKSLIRGVAFFDNNWNNLPLDSNGFFLWNGTETYFDSTGTPSLLPQTDIEATLVKAPSQLADGFYNIVAIDNAGNLHKAKVYFRQPIDIGKPTNLAQTINPDNSIMLTWTNPDLSGGQFRVQLGVTQDDLNGDGLIDTLLYVPRVSTPPMSSYTIPADFVENHLKGKKNLKWHVELRQYDSTTEFPDGSVPGVLNQFHRNYSADATLTLPGQPLAFTSDMLLGKVFFEEEIGPGSYYYADLTYFNSGTTFIMDSWELPSDIGGTLTAGWSINPSGQLVVTFSPTEVGTVTLLSDSPTQMYYSVVQNGITSDGTLQKTVPVVASKLVGTYDDDFGAVVIFNSNGTGNDSQSGDFTWVVDGAGKLTITWSDGWREELYGLASSQSTDTSYTVLRTGGKEYTSTGELWSVYSWMFTRGT